MAIQPIYRQYDRAELNAQYNNRARVPDHEQHGARWSRESAAARREVRCQLELGYGPTPPERVDVFHADSPNAPALMWIHGGYWMSRDKSDFSFMARPLVAAGVTVVMVNYALAPHVTVTEIVRQNRDAGNWLWRNASKLGVDRGRLFVGGHSAGGHLTAMLLTTDWRKFDRQLPLHLFRGGIALSGVYDLEPIRLCYLNETLHMDESEVKLISPLFNLPESAPPLLAVVGGAESEEFLRQNEAIATAWSSRGWSSQSIICPDKDHFTVLGQIVEPGNPLISAMLALVRR